MRIDIVSIFPEYLAPLKLSLIGRAIADGALDLRVHDLREHTHDRHRTVDDTPYGGGAGMVMRPEPWGEALDAILGPREVTDVETAEPGAPAHDASAADSSAPEGTVTEKAGLRASAAGDKAQRPVVIVPSPAGVPFTQAQAEELATRSHLIFACGRYEGIDQRVVDEAGDRAEVRMVSIGDYVLNGGEVASMVMVEAVARLIPGIIGNPESLTEESYEDGLLEYPVFTKPSTWRGREVPAILLSGNHAAVARWRRDQRLERTARLRPDLLEEVRGELSDADRATLRELGY